MTDQPASQGPRPSHGAMRRARPRDMLISLLVLAVPLVVITMVFTRGETPITRVDWETPLTQARADVEWPVLAPVGLPETWIPIRASWVPEGRPGLNNEPSPRNQWRLGFLDPQQIYLEVNQGDAEIESFIADTTREAVPDGSSLIHGVTWERLVTEDDRTRSLVLSTPEVTTVVVGDTSYDQLETYVGVLES